MASPSDALLTEVIDAIQIIRFNKLQDRNPLSIQTLHELNDIIAEVFTNNEVRAIIFTGIEDVFASGANIRELRGLDSTNAAEFSKLGQQIFGRIATASQLTIAAVNGYCMGGALDLALACDLRVASAKAVFAHPGAKLGIITGWGGTQRLPRLIGRTRALDMLLTARTINPSEAFEFGLVSLVADPILNRAIRLARESNKADFV
jgi:enoyl-CoA hydratase